MTCSYSWRVPDDCKGTFKITPRWPGCPFKIGRVVPARLQVGPKE